mmetsp:Transcript_49605/g.97257  ORF Transcript_49605/g.97257 Transcript_49605/m.97257 type:complete len:256 (-) Transcript_49605:6222-6989(-)
MCTAEGSGASAEVMVSWTHQTFRLANPAKTLVLVTRATPRTTQAMCATVVKEGTAPCTLASAVQQDGKLATAPKAAFPAPTLASWVTLAELVPETSASLFLALAGSTCASATLPCSTRQLCNRPAKLVPTPVPKATLVLLPKGQGTAVFRRLRLPGLSLPSATLHVGISGVNATLPTGGHQETAIPASTAGTRVWGIRAIVRWGKATGVYKTPSTAQNTLASAVLSDGTNLWVSRAARSVETLVYLTLATQLAIL